MLCAMKTILASLMCMGAMTILSGCGSSGGGTSSGGDTTCGGAIAGNWTITSSSITIDVPTIVALADQTCTGATGTGSGITLTGSAMYGTDMTYTEMSTLAGTLTVALPASCVPTGMSCADVSGMLMGDTFQAATCAAATSGCTCMLTFSPTPLTDGGMYTTSAGVLSETSTGATTADTVDYCVKTTTLTETIAKGSDSVFSGSIVLTKM